MAILTQFLFRLSWGLALAMAWTPSGLVTAGFYRVHLYVLLGMHVVTTIVAISNPQISLWPPLLAAVASYIGAVLWLYEKSRAGNVVLYLVAFLSLWGAVLSWPPAAPPRLSFPFFLAVGDIITSGLVLGSTIAAMLLGHWYLNTPTMQLTPLKRLVGLMAAALVVRLIFCGPGLLGRFLDTASSTVYAPLYFYALRWLFGFVGSLVLTAMTWATLKVPNTQSATGILYVAVIATFLGELTSLLLSLDAVYPV